jgi:hypothetical protein
MFASQKISVQRANSTVDSVFTSELTSEESSRVNGMHVANFIGEVGEALTHYHLPHAKNLMARLNSERQSMRKGRLNLANLGLITDVHCRALADVLVIHPILHTVLLDGNLITNQGAARLIACTIKQVEQFGCDWKEIGNAEHPTLVKMETMTYSALAGRRKTPLKESSERALSDAKKWVQASPTMGLPGLQASRFGEEGGGGCSCGRRSRGPRPAPVLPARTSQG